MVLTEANGITDAGWIGGVLFTNRGGGTGVGMNLRADILGSGDGTVTERAKAGEPITLDVSSSGNIQNSKYNVFVVVEQLM
jgi:hypothetical protein